MIYYYLYRVDINEDEKIVSYISLIVWSYFSLFSNNFSFSNSWKIFFTFFIYSKIKLVFNSSSSNVIRTLFFSIQFLSKIMSLEIGLIYMVIRYWSSNVLNWLFIHFFKMTFSFVIVLTSISYLVEIIFSLFFWIHVLDTIVILILELISFFLVAVLSSSSCMIIERIIRFPNLDFFSFSGLSRFLIYRRLREWSLSVWPYKIV